MIHRSFQLLRGRILKSDIADRTKLQAAANKPAVNALPAATPAVAKARQPRRANPAT